MSLVSSIQLANNALRATQIGLQVIGQNIANANTPGYIREEVVLKPAPTQRIGGVLLGLGVEVEGVIQKVDRFLEQRLRGAGSERASGETQEQVYVQLEDLVGELSDTDLSTSLNNFFSGISEILNQPESVSTRNLAVLRGRSLAADIQRLAHRVTDLRKAQNDQIVLLADDVNRLSESVRALNVKIAETEGGDIGSDAVGLRDQRGGALAALAELVDIRVAEQPDGTVNVFVGGDFLVFGGIARQVEADFGTDRGMSVAEINFAETDAPLAVTGGRLAGLMIARDEILGDFHDELDTFARTLAFEFNKLFTSGQGLDGYRSIDGEAEVDDTAAALDAAGLDFTPVNGSFQVQVFDRQTGLTETTDIFVRLNGLDDDTSLADLAAALDAVDGIAAELTPTRGLTIRSDAASLEFAFAADTSGVLAALGIATFFSGTSASGLGVNQNVLDNPALFAASNTGIGAGAGNAIELAGFLDRPLDMAGSSTLNVLYSRMVGSVTESSSAAVAVAEGFRVFEQTLLGQHLAITGVNLDEEAVRLITLQRTFQASARYIATLSELLELLVNL